MRCKITDIFTAATIASGKKMQGFFGLIGDRALPAKNVLILSNSLSKYWKNSSENRAKYRLMTSASVTVEEKEKGSRMKGACESCATDQNFAAGKTQGEEL